MLGLLQSKAVELLQALGGLLEAQAHAVEQPSLCVEPVVYHDSDRHHAEAQDVRMMCSLSRVVLAGESKILLPSGAARGALFPAIRIVRDDPVEHRRSLLHWSSMSRNQVASDGVDVDLAVHRTTAAGLVFNECSG